MKRVLILIAAIFALSTLMGAIFWDFDPAESLAHDPVVQEVEAPDTALIMSDEIRASISERFKLWTLGRVPDAVGCMMGEYIGPWQIRIDDVIWGQEVCVGAVGLFVFSHIPPNHPAQVCPLLGEIHERFPEIHDLSIIYGVNADNSFQEMGCIMRDAHEVPTLDISKQQRRS